MKNYCRLELKIVNVEKLDVITASIDPGAPDYDFYPGIDKE